MKQRVFLLVGIIFCFYAQAYKPTTIAPEKLSIKFMNLKQIEIDSARAKVLTDLDVSGNPIVGLPVTLKLAKNLKVLRLNFCTQLNLSALGKLIKDLPIEELELNNCNITFLPIDIAGIKTLKKISVENNLLQEVPWNIFYNDSLVYLNIAHNSIKELDVEKAGGLTYLNVSYNPLLQSNVFLTNISSLKKLQTLECSGAAALPKEWVLPADLNTLVMDDCKANFPKKTSGCDKIENLSLLNYNYGDLESVLAAWGCGNIKTLAVSGAVVNKLPENLGTLHKLEKLDMSCQTLISTANLNGLDALKEVHLAIKDSTALQNTLKALAGVKTLQVLDLQGSNFKTSPNELKLLSNLQEFKAENCNTENVGSCLYGLSNLKEIDLRSNKISAAQMEALIKKLPNAHVYFDAALPTNGVVDKPFPAIELKPEQFSVNNERDTVIKTANGTQIKIPAHSIVDKNKKEVKGAVQVSFTSYYDPLEIYASGITMTADSAGQQQNFASAGMFTINAKTSSNQTAYVKQGKKLQIDFVSKSPNQAFNYYYLDTIQKNWVQTGKDNINTQVKRKLIRPYPKMPLNPNKIKFAKITAVVKRATTKSPVYFSLEVSNDKKIFKSLKKDTAYYDPYEINVFNRTDWKFVGNSNRYSTLFDDKGTRYFGGGPSTKKKKKRKEYRLTSNEGVEVTIKANREKDCFDIVFYLNNDSMVVEVVPDVYNRDASKMQAAVKRSYDTYALQYRQNTGTRDNRVGKFGKEYKDYLVAMSNYEKLANAYRNKDVSTEEYKKLYDAVMKDEMDSLLKSPVSVENITRSLEVTGFGTFNCDYFSRPENTLVSTPYFVSTETNNRVNVKNITLIDLEENAYIQAQTSELKLAPQRSYWVFAKTTDNKTYFASFTTGSNNIKNIPVKFVNATSIDDLRKQLKY